MKICFPDLPLERLVDISNQMEKIKEESLEIIEAIKTHDKKLQRKYAARGYTTVTRR